jgi:hypothetical protein
VQQKSPPCGPLTRAGKSRVPTRVSVVKATDTFVSSALLHRDALFDPHPRHPHHGMAPSSAATSCWHERFTWAHDAIRVAPFHVRSFFTEYRLSGADSSGSPAIEELLS